MKTKEYGRNRYFKIETETKDSGRRFVTIFNGNKWDSEDVWSSECDNEDDWSSDDKESVASFCRLANAMQKAATFLRGE